MAEESKKLMFVPFSSSLDASFWYKLSDNKLNAYGLDESAKPIFGFYYNGYSASPTCRLSVDYTAFDSVAQAPPRHCKAQGELYLTNTIEAFKEFDQKGILKKVAEKLFKSIQSGEAIKDPSSLTQFIMLAFADLKKYHYYYWFAYPCLCLPPDVFVIKQGTLDQHFTSKQLENLLETYDQFQSAASSYQTHFLVKEVSADTFTIHSISETENLLPDKLIFAFFDPCSADDFPGWPLRNYLYLISYSWGERLSEVEIICFKDRMKNGVRSVSHSLIFSLKVPSVKGATECPTFVGWEKNERNKMGPRMVNLSHSMDPTKLAASAVDLNLKLMRWRLMPDLDLDKICNTRCLLLGSGTLGCNVARCLIGWGVRNLTLVDNGRISYSNPVRQSLFVFEDSLNGGKPKAETAAESLRKIFPGLNAVGITLSIPMPGHHVSVTGVEQTRKDVEVLEKLIEEHDAIFLLMDTRESRWLPSVIGASQQKIVINAALGFDTFLVIRHGLRNVKEGCQKSSDDNVDIPQGELPGDKLGCYFCNDVVAPGDSTKDRTLDQQCTVSRPGISMMGAALAVELLVSILQHPSGLNAPASTNSETDSFLKDTESSFGIVPHQMRGFLSRYHIVLPAASSFSKCTACSDIVLNNYRSRGFDFLYEAFNLPSYLEDLTGLTQMHQETADADILSISDEDDEHSL